MHESVSLLLSWPRMLVILLAFVWCHRGSKIRADFITRLTLSGLAASCYLYFCPTNPSYQHISTYMLVGLVWQFFGRRRWEVSFYICLLFVGRSNLNFERHRPAVAHQRDDSVGGKPSPDSKPNSLLDPQSFLFLPPSLHFYFVTVNFKTVPFLK